MITGLAESELELMRAVFRRNPDVTEVRLFGSRAKGTQQPASDVDLAAWGDLSDLRAEALRAELDELPLPYRIDVIAMAALRDAAVREHIERVGQTLYRADAH